MGSGFRPYDPATGGIGMPVAPSGGLYQAEGSNWVSIGDTTPDTYLAWSTDTTATDPGAGNIKANNADLSLATEIYVSNTAGNGLDITDLNNQLAKGDYGLINYAADNTTYLQIFADGFAVDNGTWTTIPVSVINTAGSLPDGEAIIFFVGYASPRANNIGIERLLDGLSLAASQQPTGTGELNAIQVEFGAAQGTVADAVMINANGTVTVNDTGLYRFKVSLTYGRLGAGMTSQLRFRAMVNGVQAGQSIGVVVDNSDIEIPFSDEAWLYIPAGTTIAYELMRDSSGADAGGLFQPQITAATAPNWNACSCAVIRIERWSNA